MSLISPEPAEARNSSLDDEVPQLALPFNFVRYGKFLMVGLSGAVVNLTVFVLTVDALAGLPVSNFWSSVLHFASKTAPNPWLYVVGSAVGFGVATLWNFTWNSLWTFRTSQERRHPGTRRLGLYFGVALGSLGVNELVLLATQLVLPPLFGQGIGIVAGSVVGYLGNNRYTFAEARDI
jgi:putative flippase GtrA